jgi:hypothetical protein
LKTMRADDLQRQNEALSREIEGLRSRLKQFAQMQELASMLQESHKWAGFWLFTFFPCR